MNCIICNNPFEVNKYNPRQKCCSKECNMTFQNRKKSYLKLNIYSNCKECENSFLKLRERHYFCSYSCKFKNENRKHYLQLKNEYIKMELGSYTVRKYGFKNLKENKTLLECIKLIKKIKQET